MTAGSIFAQAAGLALLGACYPPALLIAALYLASERPGRTAAFYVAGGLLIVTVVGVISLVAIRAGGLSHLGQHQTRYGLRLGLGLLAIIAAVFLYRRKGKPRDPAKPKKPSLLERLTARPSPLTAFAVGMVMFGPSLTFVTAVQVVATAKTGIGDTVGAMVMIILLTVAFAWLPLVAYFLAPVRTVRALRALDQWLERHGKTVLTVAVGVVGILLTIQGIAGLA